jgi:hypothetical protein
MSSQKDLCHLLSVTLSNIQWKKLNKEPLFFYCERRMARVMKEDTFPLSLLSRANLFKDGFELPSRVNCLKLISDLNWNTAPLKCYAEKQICTWSTCKQASTAESTFVLMWARMNRCSCVYDIRGDFPKLSPKQMLSWLETEVRPKLYR